MMLVRQKESNVVTLRHHVSDRARSGYVCRAVSNKSYDDELMLAQAQNIYKKYSIADSFGTAETFSRL